MVDMEGHDPLLTRAEVAALFRVDIKTVKRWEERGELAAIRTPGGQPRYRTSAVRALLTDVRPGCTTPAPPVTGPDPDN